MVEGGQDGDGPRRSAFAIIVVFALRPGCGGRFLELVRENAAASLRDEPDCIRFDVLRPLRGDGSEVVLFELYSSRAAFDGHLASRHFAEFDEASRALVESKTLREFSIGEDDLVA